MSNGHYDPQGAVSVHLRKSDGPTLVYVKLFDNCNLRCNMCDCWKVAPQRLTRDHAEDVVRSVLSARPRAVRFTGGEPLLYPALDSLIGMVAAHGARPVVISNGRILDRRIDGLVEAGLAELVVSIDGPVHVHDDIRGLESIGGLRAGLERLPDHIVLGVNTVVQDCNVRHLDETLDLLLDLPVRPAWWHLIPVRGQVRPDLTAAFDAITRVTAKASFQGIDMIASPSMFDESTTPCSVPQFVLFVDAISGAVFGCNILAYADDPVGNLLERPLAAIVSDRLLAELQHRCATGTHRACQRCDASSRSMNQRFRERFE